MRWTCLVVSLVCPVVCLAADAVDAGAPSTSADPALVTIDAVWRERGDPAKAEEGISLSQAALAAKPDDVERMYRLARAQLWVGDGLENNDDRKQKLGREVWDLGDRMVKGKPAWVGGHYYAAAGIGIYSQAVGILKALGEGLESKFNERLDKAIQIDPALPEGDAAHRQGALLLRAALAEAEPGQVGHLVPEGARGQSEQSPGDGLAGRDAVARW